MPWIFVNAHKLAGIQSVYLFPCEKSNRVLNSAWMGRLKQRKPFYLLLHLKMFSLSSSHGF